jgi:hypothetical protein
MAVQQLNMEINSGHPVRRIRPNEKSTVTMADLKRSRVRPIQVITPTLA